MKTLSIKIRFSLAILASVSVIAGCSETDDPAVTQANDETPTSINFAEMLMSVDREPYGFLSTTTNYNPINGTQTAYTIDGAVSTLPKFQDRVDGGTMTVGGIDVDSDPANSFIYQDIIYPDPGQALPSFGGMGTFALAGNAQNGVPSFSTTMYMPTELKILNPELSDYDNELSKSQGMTISWNADPNNSLGVAIALMYMSEDPNTDDTILWRTIEDDDGSYTLSATDLAQFSTGQDVMIGVGRMNFKIHNEDGKDYTIFAIAQSLAGATITN